MESNWQEYSLSEIIELVIDNRGRNPSCYSNVGIPVIDNYLITSEGEPELSHVKRYIDNDIYNTFIRKYNQPGDVLLTLVGNGYGKVAISPKEQCIIIQNTIGLRTKSGFDNHFLYYILKGNRTSLTNLNRGAAQPSIKVGDILNLCFYFPSYEQQITIGNTLYQLDQKIRLNRQTNQTLQQMAQTLFKSWFVDFDPVIDNALAAGSNVSDFPEALQQRAELRKQAQQLPDFKALPDDIHSLFPSEFEQTDEPNVGSHGWIPKGWDVKSLSDLLEVKYGKDHKKLNEGLYPVYGSGGLMRNAEKFLYEGESVLIPRKGTLTNIMYVNEKFWTVDTMFYTIPMLENVAKFTFYHLKTLDFTLMNVGSAVPSMTTKVLNALQVITPTTELLQKFDEIIGVNNQKVVANEFNTQQLEKLRDTLLPKLISGELTIPDSIKTENIVNHQQPKEPLSHHA
jgi:type I restriction enzyme S subunit